VHAARPGRASAVDEVNGRRRSRAVNGRSAATIHRDEIATLSRTGHGRATPAGRARTDGIVTGLDRIAVRRDMITPRVAPPSDVIMTSHKEVRPALRYVCLYLALRPGWKTTLFVVESREVIRRGMEM